MKLERYRLAKDPPLSEDYLYRYELLHERFDYRPYDDDVWRLRAQTLDVMDTKRADRGQLADILYDYNKKLGNDEAALQAARSLAEEPSLVVIGGQQAGLFTGPLMVVYKAITIIQTAQMAEKVLARPVIPVFWIAGEDHDFSEVDHLYWATPEWKVEKLRVEAGQSGKMPVSAVEIVPEEWDRMLAEMRALSRETEFTAALFKQLGEFSAHSHTLVDLFGRMLAWLFGKYGLVLMDSADPALRRLESPMMEWLVRHAEPLSEQFMAGSVAVHTLGYDSQAQTEANSANLFILQNGERIPLIKNEGRFSDRNENDVWTEEQLADIAQTEPERLSNNVLTRPLMQEYLFPVIAAVVGRSELAYWAQLKEAFHFAQMNVPPVILRNEYTLLDKPADKHMHKFSLTLDDLYHRFEQKKQAWLDEQDEWELDELFRTTKLEFKRLYEPVVERVAQVHSGMKSLAITNIEKIMEQIEFLEKRAKGAIASQNEADLRQLRRLHVSLTPMGRPQERVYNIVAYFNKYGTGWLDELMAQLLASEAELRPEHIHHIIKL